VLQVSSLRSEEYVQHIVDYTRNTQIAESLNLSQEGVRCAQTDLLHDGRHGIVINSALLCLSRSFHIIINCRKLSTSRIL